MSALRINRYILKEIIFPSIMGIVVLTFVLLMGRILPLMEMVINKGIPLIEILKLFLFLLPAFLVITLPLAFLLGILVGLGRLSADNEIIALKSSGFGLSRIARPIMFASILVCLLTAMLTLILEPAGNTAFREKIFEIASSRASVGIQPGIFNREFDDLVLYASGIDQLSGTLQGVLISDERDPSLSATIIASKGRTISDPASGVLALRLENGTIHRSPSSSQSDAPYQVIRFETYEINLNMGNQLTTTEKKSKKEKDLSLLELYHSYLETINPHERALYSTELHKRLTLPLAPFLFALVGIPLGIQSHRSGKGSGFAKALLIFLVYYLFFSFAQTLSVEGKGGGWILLWLPSVFFSIGGGILLRQASREKRWNFLDTIATIVKRLLKRG